MMNDHDWNLIRAYLDTAYFGADSRAAMRGGELARRLDSLDIHWVPAGEAVAVGGYYRGGMRMGATAVGALANAIGSSNWDAIDREALAIDS